MKNVFLIVLVSVAFFTSLIASGEDETPVRVLIVDDHGPGYYHMPTATPLRDIVRQHKDFEVVLVEDAEVLGSDLLFDYDVVLLHFKNYKVPKRDAAMKANLLKFVEDGGGLFVFHFACGAFEDWPEFEKLAGRIWDPKKPGHDPYGPFTVRIVDKEHPVTKNLPDFETSDELYTCLKDSDVPIHVLAEATSKVDGKPHPMAFVLERGKGRIFHTTLGHDEKSLSAEGFQKMIARAIRWCAGRNTVRKPTQKEVDAAAARVKEITEALPENAKLLAYLDCGGIGRFEQSIRIVAPEDAKPYRFDIEGVKVPASLATVLFGSSLSFRIEGLDRTKKYGLGLTWWDTDSGGRVQAILAKSPDESQVRILRPGKTLPDWKENSLPPESLSLSLPLAFVRDGKLLVHIQGEGGPNAVVSEIWINELP